MAQEDRPLQNVDIALSGRLRTAVDGTQLEEGDFQILRNMRYGEVSPKSVSGMTKINTSVFNGTYLKPRSGFNFHKSQPAESHLLVQAWNDELTGSKVYENTTTIPNQGNFIETELWTDASGAGIGRFSNAPDGCVAYCNGKETCIWGGNEYRCAGFILKSATVAATGIFTATSVFAEDTVTLDVKTYTFKDALTPAEGEVLRGATAVSLDHLKSAVNHTGTPDVDYSCAAAHPTVTATTNTDTTQIFEAITPGTSGNSIATTEVAWGSFGAAHLTGGLGEGDTFLYDFTDKINNTKDDSLNIAILNQDPAYVYVGSTRPLKGVKFYIKTANTSAATVSASYWAADWTAVSNLVDGTSAGGKTLAQTGSITFDSTVDAAKPKIVNHVFLYWYQFIFTGIDAATSVYYVTLDAPFQPIVDIWDGIERDVVSYFRYVESYNDEITGVLKEDYVSGNTLTYSDISSLATGSYLLCGFSERMAGIKLTFAKDKINSAVSAITISYWNGSAWTSVGTVDDNTRYAGISCSKSGFITWDAPAESLEFKNSVSGGDLWYFYKISFSATLSASVYLDYVTGIPAQKQIHGYSYPVLWGNRLWLLDDTSGKRNSAICSEMDTVCVFNGENAITPDDPMLFGGDDPLMTGGTLFTRYGGTLYDNLIILKRNEPWLIDGAIPSEFKKFQIGENYGTIAPGTFAKCDLGYELAPGLTKHIIVWRAEKAIVGFDGNSTFPISRDIENYFDPNKSEYINPSSSECGFFDPSKYEYHWIYSGGEFVFDVLRKKWFEISRGTGKTLVIGFNAQDTDGINYCYGGIETGYIERLENGTTFDGNSIISRFRTGDMPFGGLRYQSGIRFVKHIAVAKTNTTNTVTVTHYGDCPSSSSESHVFSINASGKRIAQQVKSMNWGDYTFHGLDCSLISDNENIGYEPLALSVWYKIIRENLK